MTWLTRSDRLTRSDSRAAPPRGWAFAGLVLGAWLVLVLCAPATWLARLVGQVSGQQLQLRHAQGSIWQGSAQLVLSAGDQRAHALALPGAVQWQIQPAWLGFDLKLHADCCTPTQDLKLSHRWGWHGQTLSLFSNASVWPAAILAGLGTPWNTLQPQGQLVLDSQDWQLHLQSGQWSSSGQARLQALNMSSPISTLKPLGSYELQLQGGANTTVQLQTLSGALNLNGQGQCSGAKLRFQGTASASEGKEDALNALLNLIGQRRGAQSIISLG